MRRVIGALLVLVIVGLSWFFYDRVSARPKTPSKPQFETIQVRRGDLVATVSATGVLEVEKEIPVSFEIAGRVKAIRVQEGDRVQAGEVLARLDDTDLRFQLQQAEVGLKTAEAQLKQLQSPPAAADVEAAKAALAAAQAAYRDLIAGPDPDQIASAEAAVERARVQMDQAQAAYDRIKWRPDAARMPQAIQLQLATIAYKQAQAQLRLAKKGPKESQIAQAVSGIAQAQANLDRLLRGPNQAQIEVQKTAVERARVQLNQAKRALEKTVLKAPMAGVVTAVDIKEGEMVSTARPAFVVTVLRPLHTNVQIDELDVSQVKEGQAVKVTVDALPGRTFAGVITYLASTPTVQGGVVTYKARVELQEDDPALRPGMSVSVDVITAQAKGVVIIPNRVMRVDRQTGEFYVEKLVNGVPVRTNVKVGLRNDQFSAITSGLQPGDKVVIRQVSTEQKLRRGLFGGG